MKKGERAEKPKISMKSVKIDAFLIDDKRMQGGFLSTQIQQISRTQNYIFRTRI